MNYTHIVLQWLLGASIRASALSMAVIGIQFALRRWSSPRWLYALWLPVIVVLIAPILPASRLSLETQIAPRASALLTQLSRPIVLPNEPAAQDFVAPQPSPGRMDVGEALFALWLLGVAGVTTAGLGGYAAQLRRIELGAVELDAKLEVEIARAAGQAGLRRVPRVIASTAVQSPAVSGFLRPVLLLPAGFPDPFPAVEARLILLHELMHLKRRDLPVNWLLCFLQALHWFNPLLWLSLSRMRGDREAACDAQVLSMEPVDRRSEYGHALLRMQEAASGCAIGVAFVGIFRQGSSLRSRVLAIAAHRRSHPAWSGVACAVIAALVLLGATRAEQPAAHQRNPLPGDGVSVLIGNRFIALNNNNLGFTSADRQLYQNIPKNTSIRIHKNGISPSSPDVESIEILDWRRLRQEPPLTVAYSVAPGDGPDSIILKPNQPLRPGLYSVALDGGDYQFGVETPNLTDYWTGVLKDNPTNWQAHNHLGAELYLAGKWKEAQPHFLKATELEPDNPESHNNLALTLSLSGSTEAAIQQLEIAVKLQDDSHLDSNLANAYTQAKRYDDAVRTYRHAIDLDATNGTAHCNLGYVLELQSKFDESIPELMKALELNPKMPEAREDLRGALKKKGLDPDAPAPATTGTSAFDINKALKLAK